MDYKALASKVRRVLTNPEPHPFQGEWSVDHSLHGADLLALCDAVEALEKEVRDATGAFVVADRLLEESRVNNERLTFANAALEKDRGRLNWLDKMKPNVMGGSRVSLFNANTTELHTTALAVGETFRSAVDAAITHTASSPTPTASTPTPAAPSDA